jgi:acyl-CoA thioesterase I
MNHARACRLSAPPQPGKWARLALLAALAFSGMAGAASARQPGCLVEESLSGVPKSLPELSAKIAEGGTLRVVALGSSSTEGTGQLPKSDIYAAVLERELSKELLAPVEIINKGKGGETIPKMIARIGRDVLANKPDLVIWQLGVNDVLQMDGVEGVIGPMHAALDLFREKHIPVVLVDLQAAPLVDRDKDTPIMQDAIEKEGQRSGVMHFHRRALMRRMIEEGGVSMNDLVLKDGLHMSRLGHLCTGRMLARQIARAVLSTRISVR